MFMRPVGHLCSVTAALALALAAAPAAAQSLSAPAQVIFGEPIPVLADGLAPGTQAVLRVERVNRFGDAARSETRFRADVAGRIDPATQGPTAGAYTGVDPAGPFWSMAPVKDAPSDVAQGTVRVTLLVDGKPLASAVTRQLPGDPAVRAEPVAAFAGAMLYRPPVTAAAARRLPVVIVLGGSEGGSSAGRGIGPWLATHGYAALALPYYSPGWGDWKPEIPSLPADFADIPVDRLAAVRDWIAGRPDLDAGRIGLYGVSKGGEFAILAASRFPWLKAVAAIVPSDVVWEGWGPGVTKADTRSSFAWAGKPLPFVPYKDMMKAIDALAAGGKEGLRKPHAEGRAANPDRVAAATIPIERYRGALLVAGGEDDQTWPSADMARNIAARRTAVGLRTTLLTFAGAGHGLSGSGWDPMMYEGQEPQGAATAHAQGEVARATLAMFGRTLGR